MLIVISITYFLAAVGYTITGLLLTKRKKNPFMGDDDDTHSTLEDSVWGEY